jgi:flagellin-like hook-associated protein FlgL
MRVSEQMLFRSNLGQLQRQSRLTLNAQERVSSGKRVASPSDDPASAARILRFKKILANVDQQMRNINEADRFLSVSDTVLSDVEAQLQRASELAVDMATVSKEPADRQSAAKELTQIIDQLVELANTTHDGRALFAGSQVATRPFDLERPWNGKYVGEIVDQPMTIASYDGSIPEEPQRGSDTIHLTVDGINAIVTLTPGDYDGPALANEMANQINAHPDLVEAGKSVFVEFIVDDPNFPDQGHFEIMSEAVQGHSSVTVNPPTGFNITEGENDTLEISIDGTVKQVTLRPGTYPSGKELAAELQEQLLTEGKFSVSFEGDHFLITPEEGEPFIEPMPASLLLGDARETLGLIRGTHQLSGEEYLGDDMEASVIIEPNVTLSKSLPGFRLFKGLTKTTIEFDETTEVRDTVVGVDIFADLISFKTALETNNTVGLQAAITDMGKAINQMNTERASIGARLNRLDATQTSLEEMKLSITSFKSEEEDIDLTQAISDLIRQQNALEAARAASARVLEQRSLIDFLR